MATKDEGGFLTTHVLDTARGCPAEGVQIELYRVSGMSHRKIAETVTNADGRTDSPILPTDKFRLGTYELIFFAGGYLRAAGLVEGETLFLDQVPIRFGMAEEKHYHVPLLVSPFGMSTYRGS
ncbi:MAG: hydroxyisourate hydrolase [Pseudomonadota bacterium]